MKFTRQTIEYAPPVGSSAGLSQPRKGGALFKIRQVHYQSHRFCISLRHAVCTLRQPGMGASARGAAIVGQATGCNAVITVTSVDGSQGNATML